LGLLEVLYLPLVPEVKLKDYKKYIKNEKVKMEKEKDAIAASKEAASKKEPDAQSKSDEPNAELAASSSKLEAEKPASLMLSSIFDILLKESELEVPELLTHEEVNRRLTQLLDDIKKVGLTPEQYLSSKKMTEEELQKQYFKDSEDMYKIEFIIAKIADEEKLTVAPTELENILGLAKTDEEKAIAQRNMAWYETLLRKQKVIDFLNTL
jgi:trigger factor